MQKIVTLIGLPKSGKTTWALEQGHPIVNRDAIRLAMHGQRYIQKAEDIVTVFETNMAAALIIAGHEVVVIDACHNTEKRSARWHTLADSLGVEWEPLFIRTGKSVCIERAMAVKDYEIIPIIERMYAEADWNPPE